MTLGTLTIRTVLTGLAVLFLAGLPSAHAQDAAPSASPTIRHWFHTVHSPAVLKSASVADLCRWVSASLREGSPQPDLPSPAEDRSGPSLAAVTIRGGNRPAAAVFGAGNSLADAVRDATQRLLQDQSGDAARGTAPETTPPGGRVSARASHADRSPRAAPDGFRLDLVQYAWQPPNFVIRRSPIPAPGLCGVAFSPQSGLAFLPAELLAADAINAERRLGIHRVEYLLASRERWQKLGRWNVIGNVTTPLPVCFFECQSVYFDGKTPHLILRNHLMPRPLTPDKLADAAHSGADFLLTALQQSPGALTCRTPVPGTETTPGDIGLESLSAMDLSGCALALFDYADTFGRAQAGDQARRLCKRLVDRLREGKTSPNALHCTENGVAKLATNAQVARALLRAGKPPFTKAAQRVGLFLVGMQMRGGGFAARRNTLTDSRILENKPAPSAGAILALVKLYEATADARFLTHARRGFVAYQNQHIGDREMDDLPRSPLLPAALNALYTYNRTQEIKTLALRIALAYEAEQTLDPPVPDLFGSVAGNLSATQAALRVQGLSECLDLLRAAHPERDYRNLTAATHAYLLFQRQAQMGPVATLFTRSPQTYHGAFRDDPAAIRFRPHDQWIQLSALANAYRQLQNTNKKDDATTTAPSRLPLTKRQQRALLNCYRQAVTFPRALP